MLFSIEDCALKDVTNHVFVMSTSIDLLEFSNNSNTWLPQQVGGVRPVNKYPHATAYLRLPIPYTRMDIYYGF